MWCLYYVDDHREKQFLNYIPLDNPPLICLILYSMPRRVVVFIIAGILVIVGIPLIVFTITNTTTPSPLQPPSPMTNPYPSQVNQDTKLPISKNHANVRDIKVTNEVVEYTLSSKIKSITAHSLVLLSYDANIPLPSLKLTQNTNVFRWVPNQQLYPAHKTDLAPDQMVLVKVKHNPKDNSWLVQSITFTDTQKR